MGIVQPIDISYNDVKIDAIEPKDKEWAAPADINWSKSHCGIFQAPMENYQKLMPELMPIMYKFPENPRKYTLDVKVHMLMPDQYPCIPGWHYDMIPRDEKLKPMPDKATGESMWAWISGFPLTEFEGGFVKPQTWVPFTQSEKHRGTSSATHTWRCFIRAVPRTILKPADDDKWLRRHSQVYLDAEKFQW